MNRVAIGKLIDDTTMEDLLDYIDSNDSILSTWQGSLLRDSDDCYFTIIRDYNGIYHIIELNINTD